MNEENIERWITANGNHIPIRKGQTEKQAIRAFRMEQAKKKPLSELKQQLEIPLDFFAKKGITQTRTYNSKEPPQYSKEAFGFARLDTEHHRNHAAEMGYKNQKEYEKAAIKFWNEGNGTTYYSQARNSFYKYNENTKELVIVSSDGTIHTFMNRTKIQFLRDLRWEKLERYDKV